MVSLWLVAPAVRNVTKLQILVYMEETLHLPATGSSFTTTTNRAAMHKPSMCLLQDISAHYYAYLHPSLLSIDTSCTKHIRWLIVITIMKTTIVILTAWMVLVGIADHNRQAPTQEEINAHCIQVELTNGSFVCE